MTDTALPPVRDCEQYAPGHSVHWIQARLTWLEPLAHVAVEVVEIANTQLVVSDAHGLRRFWNHDLRRLRAVVDKHGPHGALVGYNVLRLEAGHLFCVKEDSEGPLDPCLGSLRTR
jgi:hypothetical protein